MHLSKSLLMFILSIILLSGCCRQLEMTSDMSLSSNDDVTETSAIVQIPEYAYEPSQYSFRFIEKYGYSMIYNDKTMNIRVESVHYYFDEELEVDVCNRCVYWTKQILDQIGLDIELEIYVFEGYEGIWIEDNTLYTGNTNFETVDYVTELILAAGGGFVNYGAAYGLANYIASQLGWESDVVVNEPIYDIDIAKDLNYLCFNPAFVGEEKVSAAKDISIRFVEELIATKGQEIAVQLVLASGSPKTAHQFEVELSEWYRNKAVSYKPATILFCPGGERYEFLAYCEYARFYIPKTWTEMYYSERFKPEFLHEDYSFVKEYLETTKEQMTALRNLFGYDDYNDNLNIVFDESKSSSYYGAEDDIFILSSISVMHEYTHALTKNHERPSGDGTQWISEGGVTYFSQKHDRFRYEIINYQSNHRHDIYEQVHEGYYYFFLDQLILELGRELNLNTEKDFRIYNDLICYTYNQYSLTGRSATNAGVAFIKYLVDIYGENTIKNFLFSEKSAPTREELIFTQLDRPIEELREEWKTSIEEKYARYEKYKN